MAQLRATKMGLHRKGSPMIKGEHSMSTITTKDGTQIYYKDWGSGGPVVFSHGWPLSADAWEDQMVFLGAHGYRCIAHDRRGHGRSSQPWNGNDMDTDRKSTRLNSSHLVISYAVFCLKKKNRRNP